MPLYEIVLRFLGALLVFVLVVVAGGPIAGFVRDQMRGGPARVEAGDEDAELTGYVERACIAALAMAGPLFALSGVVAWASLRYGANRGAREPDVGLHEEGERSGGFSGVAGSLVSLTIALLGGAFMGWLLRL